MEEMEMTEGLSPALIETGRDACLSTGSAGSAPRGNEGTPLAPMDGGINAWLFLAACFTMEALIWGFAFTYGVFQEYYSHVPEFKSSRNIPVIGTSALGVMYLDLPFIFIAYRQWPHYQRLGCAAGVFVMCLALGLSSLSTSVTHLIVSQGIMYGIGASVAYTPLIFLIEDWFNKRKGLAFGVMWAGTGLGGIVLPIVMERLLNKYGFSTTLRIYSIALFILIAPLVFYVKPRVAITKNRTSPPPPNLGFLFTSTFALYQIFNVIQALGFFLPSLYLPTYAGMMGASSGLRALTVILSNMGAVVGCVIMGAIVDKLHVTTCILISTIGSTLAVFLLWGFSISLAPLFLFAIVYGLFAGAYTSTWPGIMRDVVRKQASAESSMVLAFLATGRGIGNVVSGPLSEALIKGRPWQGHASFGYGSGYGTLIAFTGITGIVGGGSYVARCLKWL